MYALFSGMTRAQKGAVFFVFDLAMILLAFWSAQALVAAMIPDQLTFFDTLWHMLALVGISGGFILWRRMHRIRLNSFGSQGTAESVRLAILVAASSLVLDRMLWGGGHLPHEFHVVFGMMVMVFTIAGRLIARHIVTEVYRRGQNRTRVVIYGAGQTGQQLAAGLITDPDLEAVCFVDDNLALERLTIQGLRVHSPRVLDGLIAEHNIDRVILAMPSATASERHRIMVRLKKLGCEVHSLPPFAQMLARGGGNSAKPVEIATLLGRCDLERELPIMNESYLGRSVLVTGAGGSIGSELCRQLLGCGIRRLVVLDHSEWALYTIDRELRDLAPDLDVVAVLGSIMQPDLVGDTIADHEVDVVLHAAAYKHVPIVEHNLIEGLRNNILGTQIVVQAAEKAGVERFILVSSDKAVRPTSIMGASKRMAEQIVQDRASRSTKTCFSMVRFGNVLGSSGSVIPLFEEQIRKGGPVTLTHPDVTRYFMTVPEAAGLVLVAGSFARGGDVFVLDMGEPVGIATLARQMIESSGYTVREPSNPDGDIEICVTGLRPGEKMHEELLIGSDMLMTPHEKILCAQEEHLSEIEMANFLKSLKNIVDMRDDAGARAIMSRWIIRDADEQKPLFHTAN